MANAALPHATSCACRMLQAALRCTALPRCHSAQDCSASAGASRSARKCIIANTKCFFSSRVYDFYHYTIMEFAGLLTAYFIYLTITHISGSFCNICRNKCKPDLQNCARQSTSKSTATDRNLSTFTRIPQLLHGKKTWQTFANLHRLQFWNGDDSE